jgi:uncharacterized protein YbaR (Trm112 family)
MFKKKIKKYLICTNCKSKKLKDFNSKIICKSCNQNYPIIFGIPILITKKKCLGLNLNYHKKDFEKRWYEEDEPKVIVQKWLLGVVRK